MTSAIIIFITVIIIVSLATEGVACGAVCKLN